jgi:CRP/FNR family transcriptional regulator, cyclic AMP receptor protein
MPFDEEVRALSRVEDVLEPLSREEREGLAGRVSGTLLERGELLFGPEDSGRVFALKEGRVEVYPQAGEGRVLTLGFDDAGTVFGERTLDPDRPQGTYARALEPSLVGSITSEDLENLVRRNPEVGLQLIRLLNERLHACSDRMADLATKDTSGRLAGLLLYLLEAEGIRTPEGYRIPVRYTHEQLGAMIGVRRVAVSRAFGNLKDKGAVEYVGRELLIRDPKALKRAWGSE